MIVWCGYGWIALAIIVIFKEATRSVVNSIFSYPYYEANFWPQIVAAMVISFILGSVGFVLNTRFRKKVEDSESGELLLEPSHSFFFVPVQYWALCKR